jgi:hypothetical protein
MSSNLHPMLNVAIKAARAAGAIINRAALDVEAVRISQKQVNDFVTEVDHASEAAIIETLLTAYPGHGILAEESGSEHGAKDSDYIWIIDPLDGTTNFIHGFPVYCVSIALAVKGKVEQAVVYDPTRNDLFTATKGRGAFMNERRIRVSKRTDSSRLPDLHRLSVPPGRQLQELPGHDGRRDAAHRRPAPPRRRRTGPGLRGRRLHRRLLRDRPVALGRGRGLAAGDRGRRPGGQLHRRGRLSGTAGMPGRPPAPRKTRASTASWWA